MEGDAGGGGGVVSEAAAVDQGNDVGGAVTLEPGRYLGLRFDWLGRTKGSRAYTFGHERTLSTSAHAVINGRHYLMLSSGPLAGYWVRDTPQVHPA